MSTVGIDLPEATKDRNVVTRGVWNRLVREVKRLGQWSVDGADFRSDPGGMGLRIPTAPPAAVLLAITGNETGGGKYTGYVVNAPSVGAAASGDLTDGEIGTGTGTVRILNTREEGKSTHDLESTGYLPKKFVGVFRNIAADGVPVYVIDGRQSKDCT